MFGLGLLFTLVVGGLLYGLVALAVVSYAAYRKNSIVPDIARTGSGYAKKFNDKQKSARDMWECVQVFSFAWPIEAVVGFFMGGWHVLTKGVRYLASLSGDRAQRATERKLTVKLEEAREEALAIENDYQRKEALASLDFLMNNHASSRLALTGGK